ncbi:uroporphyrinogen-III C-methyltransferase [Mesocricetibacter intestinalis]|uniref:Siroheme synthase n=1 Tax=Mesocricetibacter intestinalis TaxID=1521930 RepID=A0A4R6VEE0_9PAST|nr:siroheme synthase CysG [Mesocricetibacter intestinalis]TDQ58971.1 uroporphyrinogen-III C-methyltransferase [Mesocricetibacter intestinalis]
MNYLPVFADLKGRPVLVVGGGSVAARKIALLLKAGAQVRVTAQMLNSTLEQLYQRANISWIAREFNSSQLESVFLVIAATDDEQLNQRVFQAAERRHKLVNVVDDQAHCSFIFPSIIDRHPLQIAISSGGTAPVLARLLREKLEALLPQHLGAMAQLSGQWRNQVKERLKTVTERRRFWEGIFNGPVARLVKNRRLEEAERELSRQLQRDYRGGSVALVGAGPGDAGLLTLKGLQELQQADVVLYDALVSEQVLELIRRDAERIFVGKRAGGEQMAQQEINRLLVRFATRGKRVVRLKGGDPFVFGRGGEELEILAQHHIPFSLVPGITAAIGASAYAGIPLTHRDYAQSVLFVSGQLKADSAPIEWQTLARSRQTLVIYMGTLKAADISANLQSHGRAPDTPVAVISQATRAAQRTRVGTLLNLSELASEAETPALIVIGEVVALQEKLAWFGEQKLYQKQPHFTLDSLNPHWDQVA